MDDGKFSRYEIRGELGSGGMAKVYRAYDPEFDREVALKILRREMLEEAHLRERFEREIKIIAKLELEAIVPVYDVGREKDRLFFVMRLMSGGTLSDRLKDGPLPPAQIIRIIQRIAPALDDAHARGIIHRDLKPGNILFDEHDNAFISDFGIAKSMNVTLADPETDTSGVVGTPRYMSPEQARAERLDARSDIYSLGVIVLEMLIGKTRFDAITPLGLAFREESKPVPNILESNPDLPASVQKAMEKVLARERDQRYASAAEFAQALTAAFSEPPTSPLRPVDGKPMFVLRFLAVGGIAALIIIAFVFWREPGVAPPIPSTPPAATPTILPSTPTSSPTASPTPPRTPTVTVTSIVIPGGADKIALTANDEIYLVNIDGSDPEALTQSGLPKFDLQWLPGRRELLYVEGNCVHRIDVETVRAEAEQPICFTDSKLLGFRVSPDGERVAISIANRLLVLPFDLQVLSSVSRVFELQKLESLCLDYAEETVKGALWSTDGRRLAIRYQSVVNGRIGDTIRVIQGNWERCREVAVLEWDEFPADHFVPNGYAQFPILPSYQWDGDQRFLLNSFIRNASYGDLYLYDMAAETARKINPIHGVCCYSSAAFSPDGTHILLVFQDVRLGFDSENKLYYIPIEQLGTGAEFTPIRLPRLFFQDLRENIQLALRPAVP